MKTICDCANALADIERDLETFEEHLEGTYVRTYVLTEVLTCTLPNFIILKFVSLHLRKRLIFLFTKT
jgi:hypothetical protein